MPTEEASPLTPPPYSCGQAFITTTYPLHSDTFEARLHQEIKHHVNHFKASVQQLLSEQLGLAQTYPAEDCHLVPSDDPQDTAYGLETDLYHLPERYLCSEPCRSFDFDKQDEFCTDNNR